MSLAAGFRLPVRVYIEDTDAGGIVYYVNYLKFLERARTEWLRDLGHEQCDLMQLGLVFVVHSLDVRYRRSAHLDQRLEVLALVSAFSPASLTFQQEIRDQGGDLLVDARVKVAAVDADSRRPRRLPADLYAQLQQLSCSSAQ